MAKCPECQKRPIGGGPLDGTWNDREDAKQHDMCLVCLAEAYWTNVHSDYAHEILKAEGASTDEQNYDLANCWVCHPELDKSSEAYVQRTGTSRQGMEMVVTLRADAATKAGQVKAQLPKGFKTSTQVGGAHGILAVRLTGSRGAKDAKVAFEANWDDRGRWVAGTVNGKKVRNAKELLRVLGA